MQQSPNRRREREESVGSAGKAKAMPSPPEFMHLKRSGRVNKCRKIPLDSKVAWTSRLTWEVRRQGSNLTAVVLKESKRLRVDELFTPTESGPRLSAALLTLHVGVEISEDELSMWQHQKQHWEAPNSDRKRPFGTQDVIESSA